MPGLLHPSPGPGGFRSVIWQSGQSQVAELPYYHVRLLTEFRSDLHWWASFLPKWNGKSMLPQPEPSHTITFDISGSWGCGAFSSDELWFQLARPASWSQFHMAAKEMVLVVVSIAIWGALWVSSSVLICSDNMAVVSAINSGSVKDHLLMHLSRCLHFFLAHFDIRLVARHIAGIYNTAADALSHNNLGIFFKCFPQASRIQAQVPDSLQDMLLLHRRDWLCPSWRHMFLDTLGKL